MATPEKQLINLLPQEEFASSTLGRILKWVLSTFRVIVVITEVVVMGAFLSRFYLDARNSDLNNAIKQKKATIEAYASIEREFRRAQKKIQILGNLIKNENKITNDLTSVAALIPQDTNLTSFSYLENDISVRAITPFETSVSQFIANLRASGKYTNVELSQITTTDTAGQYDFMVEIKKGAAGATEGEENAE